MRRERSPVLRLSRCRPRFTVRWLMVAVAISGLFFWSWQSVEKRRARFEKLCQEHFSELLYLGCQNAQAYRLGLQDQRDVQKIAL